MKIYIDERERELYTYLQQKNTNNIVIVKEVLSLGDVILKTDDENQRKNYAQATSSTRS